MGKEEEEHFQVLPSKEKQNWLRFYFAQLSAFRLEMSRSHPQQERPDMTAEQRSQTLKISHTEKRKSSSEWKPEVCLCSNTCNHCQKEAVGLFLGIYF